jgi:RHS repeat-associated protein
LTAKATDDKGAVTTSAARSITVEGTAVSGNVYYIHTDHLDTPREITNEQNQTVWKNPPLTEPFGSTPVDEDPDGDGQAFTFNLRFPGQYYDQETGVHYNYFRDNYLPDFGRYGQSDPIGLAGGINTYAYVRGNPLLWSDWWGLSPEDVERIRKAFEESIRRMNEAGQRRPGSGWGNGIKNNYCQYDWIAKIFKCEDKETYDGCKGQAERLRDDLMEELKKMQFDDEWRIDLTFFPIHFYIEAFSSNQNDPFLRMDPWRNSFDAINRYPSPPNIREGER